MPAREGNVLRPPGTTQTGPVGGEEILASTSRFLQKGVTLAGGQGVLAAGTMLGRVTATKKYKAYANGASDGTEVARGILRMAVDTGTGGSSEDKLGNIVYGGVVKLSLIVGLDSNADADLNARRDADRDYYIF